MMLCPSAARHARCQATGNRQQAVTPTQLVPEYWACGLTNDKVALFIACSDSDMNYLNYLQTTYSTNTDYSTNYYQYFVLDSRSNGRLSSCPWLFPVLTIPSTPTFSSDVSKLFLRL